MPGTALEHIFLEYAPKKKHKQKKRLFGVLQFLIWQVRTDLLYAIIPDNLLLTESWLDI